jgi:hypothetical protein
MPTRDTDTRTVSIVDIPLVRRLTERGVVLDSELEYTRDAHGPNGAVLSSILLPQRGLYTLVARSDKQQVVGQFRLRGEDQNAHLVYVAPEPTENCDDTAWLHILDAMAREAGKHKAHALVAEVHENSLLFETMRTAGFAVYARQEIWRRQPGNHPAVDLDITLVEQTDEDIPGIYALMAHTVPSLLQPIMPGPEYATTGLLYRKNDRCEAYLAVSEGKHGVYIVPYMDPDIVLEASAVFDTAIRQIQRTSKAPVFVCVYRHQDWITGTLHQLGFERGRGQAIMVRHITAGVRQATFTPVEHGLPVTPVKPPTNPLQSRFHNISRYQNNAGATKLTVWNDG